MSANNSIDEFYLPAVEFCKLVEYTTDTDKIDFISKSMKILSFVYLKASLLSKPIEVPEGEAEKFVQEEEWIYIKNNIANVMGSTDKFIDIVLPEQADPENYENVRLSESFADIYQDLKNFATSYEIGNSDGLQVSLYDCILNFEKFWGQRLLATLSYLHNYLYNIELYEEDEFDLNNTNQQDADTTNWLINQRFDD